MYKIKYQRYHNDSSSKHEEMTFGTLREIQDWIFENTNDIKGVWFPREDNIGRISFYSTDDYYFSWWIHEIDSSEGILFSDGYYTGKQKHLSKKLLPWIQDCNERKNKGYNFV